MKPKRDLLIGTTFVVLIALLAYGQKALVKPGTDAKVQAPMFEVDPMWPKPLPNHWIMGNTIGVSVDAQDHVWIIHRQGSLEAKEVYATTNPPGSSCCLPAPPVLSFDQAGNLIQHWGGPGAGYEWPDSNHGITVDYKGTSGSAETAWDRHLALEARLRVRVARRRRRPRRLAWLIPTTA